MTRRRTPRGFPQRVTTAIESMIPGTVGGRVANASPVAGARSDGDAENLGAVGSGVNGSESDFYRDRFVLAADGPQDVTLTYTPVDYSEHVYLNGVELDEGDDWTRDDVTVTLLAAADVLAGDVVDVRYAYLSGAPVTPDEPAVLPDSTTGDTTGSLGDATPTTFAVVLASARNASGSPGALTVQVQAADGTWRTITQRFGTGTTHITSGVHPFAPADGDQQVRISGTVGDTISGALVLIPGLGATVNADSPTSRSSATFTGTNTDSSGALNPATYVAGDVTLYYVLEQADNSPGVNSAYGPPAITGAGVTEFYTGTVGATGWAVGYRTDGAAATATRNPASPSGTSGDDIDAWADVLPAV